METKIKEEWNFDGEIKITVAEFMEIIGKVREDERRRTHLEIARLTAAQNKETNTL